MWVLLLNRLIRETSHGLCATDAQMVKVTLGEKNEVILTDGSVLSNLKQLSSGLLRNHEEYSKGSKLQLIKNNTSK